MDDALRQTWDDLARHWDDWGPPLRPCAEDLQILHDAMVRWRAVNAIDPVRVFLCGITPEIATMAWPFPIQLTAMDQAESMVRIVWPGDVPGVRRGMVGNWTDPGLPAESQDVVIGDGGFGFFDYAIGQRKLAAEMARLLRPGGLFVYRHYAQLEQRETLDEVLRDSRAGRIGNFHIFKWRVAIALQPDAVSGVVQHDIWQACSDAGIIPTNPYDPSWSARSIDTIRFYKNKQSRLFFPTERELHDLLADHFADISVVRPTYELGERCPVFVASRANG